MMTWYNSSRESGTQPGEQLGPLHLADFDIIGRLGEGSYSHVVEVILSRSSKHYALKVVDKHLVLKNKQVDNIKQEKVILQKLNHPGIVKLCFTFQDETSLYFGLEVCPNGELYEQIEKRSAFPEDWVKLYAAEIVDILNYLRCAEVVHCDLKPENLLLDNEGHLKLADFGSALDLGKLAISDTLPWRKTALKLLTGTADYVSPEMLQGQEVGYAADLWALGCVLVQMLTGRPPFKAASEYLTFQKVLEANYRLPDTFSTSAQDLVLQLLQLDPKDRLGYGEDGMKVLQNHDFFSGIQWETLRDSCSPPLAPKSPATASNDAVEFDWTLSSLASKFPLRHEYP